MRKLREVVAMILVVPFFAIAGFWVIQAPRTAGFNRFHSIPRGATRAEITDTLGEPVAEIRSRNELKQLFPNASDIDAPSEGSLLVFRLSFTPVFVGTYLDCDDRLTRKVEIQSD